MGVVVATAPVRICDLGGWTDTWFAGHGAVFHIAVTPGAEVRALVDDGAGAGAVTLDVAGSGGPYSFELPVLPGRHPLLEATIAEVGLPDDAGVRLAVSSGVPAGSSTGTSAAVTVALIGALDRLAGTSRTPHDVASLAHRIETERLGTESGVQDQFAAAFGGINYVEISAYPEARVTQVRVVETVWESLDRRLLLVLLGRPHVSSAVHGLVIAQLGNGVAAGSSELADLRQAAADGRDAVERGDLEALGQAMIANTEAQRRLHPELVSADAQRVIDVAARRGAWGWKVNGAGGEGGSVTILCREDEGPALTGLVKAIAGADPLFDVVPVRVSRDGLRVEGASDS